MATQDQNFKVLFKDGPDMTGDPKNALPQEFTRLENVQFAEADTIRLRDGVGTNLAPPTLVPTPYFAGVGLSGIRQATPFGDELLIEDDNGLRSVGAGLANLYQRDTISGTPHPWERCRCVIENLGSAGSATVLELDGAVSPLYECWAWSERRAVGSSTNYRVVVQVREIATNTIVMQQVVSATTTTNARRPRVIATTNKFYVYFKEDTKITVARINTADGQLASTATALTNVTNVSTFDAYIPAIGSAAITVAYTDSVSGHIKLGEFNPSDGTTVSRAFLDTGVTASGGCSVCQLQVGGNTVDFTAFTQGNNLTLFASNGTTTGTLTTAAFLGLGRVTCAPSLTANNVRVWFDYNPGYDAAEPFMNDVWAIEVTSLVSAMATAVINGQSASFTVGRGVCLAGRPFVSSTPADYYVPVLPSYAPGFYATIIPQQPTLFLLKSRTQELLSTAPNAFSLDLTPNSVVAKVLPGEFGLTPGSAGLDESVRVRLPTPFTGGRSTIGQADPAQTFTYPVLRLGRPVAAGTVISQPAFAAAGRVQMGTRGDSVIAQKSLLMLGSAPHLYDGQNFHEAGFHLFPEGVTVAGRAAGALLASQTYGVCFVFEWTDKNGVLHRSAPSTPVFVTLTAGQNSFTAKCPYLRLTRKTGIQSYANIATSDQTNPVRVVAYRTVANGTLFFRDLSGVTTDASNNTGLNTMFTWISDQTDASISSGELLYTTGGIIPNLPFPAATFGCIHQRRVFMVLESDPNTVQYTDEIDDQYDAPATNPTFYQIPISADYGRVCWLESLDGKLIVTCERGVFAVFGDAPDRAGNNNTLTLPQVVLAAKGGRWTGEGFQGHVQTPDGIWFLSGDGGGWRLLTRGMQLAQRDDGREFGSELDQDTSGQSIGAAGANTFAVTARYSNQFYCMANASQPVLWIWDSLWNKWSVNLFGLIPFSPVGMVPFGGSMVLFDQNHLRLMDINHTDSGNVVGVVETAWLSMADLNGFQRAKRVMLLGSGTGGSVTLEVATDYGAYTETTGAHSIVGATDPLQLEHQIVNQKCSAIRFRITLRGGPAVVKLTGLTLRAGMKRGLLKVPSSQRI